MCVHVCVSCECVCRALCFVCFISSLLQFSRLPSTPSHSPPSPHHHHHQWLQQRQSALALCALPKLPHPCEPGDGAELPPREHYRDGHGQPAGRRRRQARLGAARQGGEEHSRPDAALKCKQKAVCCIVTRGCAALVVVPSGAGIVCVVPCATAVPICRGRFSSQHRHLHHYEQQQQQQQQQLQQRHRQNWLLVSHCSLEPPALNISQLHVCLRCELPFHVPRM